MVAPPLEAGAVQLTATQAFPLVTVPMVGRARGTVAGVTELVAADWLLSPALLMAATVKV